MRHLILFGIGGIFACLVSHGKFKLTSAQIPGHQTSKQVLRFFKDLSHLGFGDRIASIMEDAGGCDAVKGILTASVLGFD